MLFPTRDSYFIFLLSLRQKKKRKRKQIWRDWFRVRHLCFLPGKHSTSEKRKEMSRLFLSNEVQSWRRARLTLCVVMRQLFPLGMCMSARGHLWAAAPRRYTERDSTGGMLLFVSNRARTQQDTHSISHERHFRHVLFLSHVRTCPFFFILLLDLCCFHFTSAICTRESKYHEILFCFSYFSLPRWWW